MIGNKQLDQKGFMLLEAVISWLVLVTCLMIYIPFLMNMTLSIKNSRNEVELTRIGYEQIQKSLLAEPIETTWITAGKTYYISEQEAGRWKGIRVYEKEQEWTLQMLSFTNTTAQ
ncbi:hypothetical protein [Desemzia sp. FAM 23991]|uniref:hypothetical protein n=1 Tax=unclassified Desemzia TaxID=2685243 RepID=UPI003884A27D